MTDKHKLLTGTCALLDHDVGLLIQLSPFYQDQLAPLLGVLQMSKTLKGKLVEGGKLKVLKCLIVEDVCT